MFAVDRLIAEIQLETPMNTRSLAGLSLALVALSGPALARVADNDFHLASGEFAIHNGETKTLATGSREHDYRICVNHGWHSVPLRIMHDGMDTVVQPGDCTSVRGRNVALSPDAKLVHDTVLIGRHRVS